MATNSRNPDLPRQVEGATGQSALDLSVATAHTSTDPWVIEFNDALEACLQEAGTTVNAALEMKHTLLLLVKAFHDLCDSMEYRQQEWLWRMRITVGGGDGGSGGENSDEHEGGRYNEPETVRELTGQIIVEHFEVAPWSLQKRPGQQRSDAVHTILATHAGIVRFLRGLRAGLEKTARDGVDLSRFDVPEMRPEEDEDEEDAHPVEENTSMTKTTLPELLSDSSPIKAIWEAGRKDQEQAPTPKNLTNSAKRPRRNPFPNQGPPASWTDEERIALLKLYRDNPWMTNQQLTDLHMARPNSVPNANRSVHSVQQEIGKQLGAGPKPLRLQVVQAKIDELEQ